MENVDFYDELKTDFISFDNLCHLQELLKELMTDATVTNKEYYSRIINSKIRLVKKGLRRKGFTL